MRHTFSISKFPHLSHPDFFAISFFFPHPHIKLWQFLSIKAISIPMLVVDGKRTSSFVVKWDEDKKKKKTKELSLMLSCIKISFKMMREREWKRKFKVNFLANEKKMYTFSRGVVLEKISCVQKKGFLNLHYVRTVVIKREKEKFSGRREKLEILTFQHEMQLIRK